MKNLQTMKQSVQKGFTLIELMIVVAIIGILAALAIPAYTDYTIKSRVGEGASLSGAFKTAIDIYWSENGTLSGLTDDSVNTTALGTAAVQGQYVSSILIQVEANRPELEILYRTTTKLGTAATTCLRYVPAPGAGSNLIWGVNTTNCTAAVPAKYIPRT
ncbi:MAG: pilin [Cycloclasticus sp.]